MRRNPTPAERAFRALLDSAGFRYKHQAAFFSSDALFIADFRLANDYKRVLVEIDGSSHDGKAGYDAYRTRWLERRRNAQIIRFRNEDVLTNPEHVLAVLKSIVPPLRMRVRP